MNGSRLIKRPLRLNRSLYLWIDRGQSRSDRRYRSLLLALNGMGATSDQCQCESDKDLTVFEIENHEYLPTTAQAIAAPYKFPPTTSITGVQRFVIGRSWVQLPLSAPALKMQV